MKTPPPLTRAVAIAVIIAIVAGLGWLGWWLFRKAYAWSSALEPSVVLGVITALVCTTLVVLAITWSGPARAARLRGRAEAYQAALTLILRSTQRPGNRAEWRRMRTRLLLWASARVLRQFDDIQDHALWLQIGQREAVAKLAALTRAMRLDLGQSDIGSDFDVEPEDEGEPEDEAES